MAYLGLTPSEYSSGARRRFWGITKAGNSHARRALVEGAWAYRYPAKVSEHLQRRIETTPECAGRVHLVDCAANTDHRVTHKAPLKCTIQPTHRKRRSPGDDATLEGVKRQPTRVPRPRQAFDGHKEGGNQPADISMINRRIYWLRLFRWVGQSP